jgi:Tfp pilus assembly major pilin PilA
MESSVQQATLGKMALGIRVTDGQGRRVSFGRATGRHFAKLLSGLILLIGYLMAGFTVRKQALHDMIAGCLVVNRGAPADLLEKGVKGGSMPGWAVALIIVGALFVPIAGIVAAITIPAYQDFTMRAKVAMAMVAGRGATRAVEEFYARNKSLPGDLKEAGAPAHDSNHVRSVTLDPRSGAVRVVLAGASVEGKSILFEPVREGDGRVTWTCGSADRDSPVINNVVDFLQWPPAL